MITLDQIDALEKDAQQYPNFYQISTPTLFSLIEAARFDTRLVNYANMLLASMGDEQQKRQTIAAVLMQFSIEISTLNLLKASSSSEETLNALDAMLSETEARLRSLR